MDVNLSDKISKNAYWFLFHNDELLVKNSEGRFTIPLASDLKGLASELTSVQSIGVFHEQECIIANICNDNIPPEFSFQKVRPLYGCLEDDFFGIACRAFHINSWMKTSKFCGCCGNTMNSLSHEIAMKCSKCDHIVYPRISPAIIVAVVKDNQILLARSNRFPPNRYSVIAGFVEPGENLEECVRRELEEEVGIEVHNISYFGSQPWSFPDSLMVAFTAQCSTEKITIDNQEIVAAAWFSPHNLPDIPDKPSIGRQLIDWYTEKYK